MGKATVRNVLVFRDLLNAEGIRSKARLRRALEPGGEPIPGLYLGSSLNTVVVSNLEVPHAARLALKTTSAFIEETKKKMLKKGAATLH